MTQAVHFLSWIRDGLSWAIPGTGSLDQLGPTAVGLPIQLVLGAPDGHGGTATGQITARLHGPGDVLGLAPEAIGRMYPPPGTLNAERSWFPYVEFTDARLPWLLSTETPQQDSPGAPTARRGLRPWLTLVVLPVEAAEFTPAGPDRLATLVAPVAELPDLATAWLWTHAQVNTDDPSDPVPAALAADPSRGLARALCPRRLQADTGYLACLVPTTDAGVRAGLGQPVGPDDGALHYAWQSGAAGTVTLPVYHSWTFSTGADGDIRALVDRLTPCELATVGVRPLDVGNAGGDWPGPADGAPAWVIELEGSLVAAQVQPGSWPDPAVAGQVQQALRQRLAEAGAALRPPLYGGWQAGQAELPDGPGWLTTLNTDPRYRVAAGAGARLVRAQQQTLIAAAWEQAGELAAANQLLRAAQLARAAGARRYAATVASGQSAALDDATLLQVSSGAHQAIASDSATPLAKTSAAAPVSVAQVLAGNSSAAASSSTAFRRLTRPGGPLARRVGGPITALSRVADPAADTGQVVPELTPVSGTLTLPGLSPAGAPPVTLRALTAQLVAVPRLPWETGSRTLAVATTTGQPRDGLLAPGYLSDAWAYPTGVGVLTDWDGTPLHGWRPFGPPPITASYARPVGIVSHSGVRQSGGGAVAVFPLSQQANPAIAAAALSAVTIEWGSYNSWQCTATVSLELRGDLIPGMSSPISPITHPDGPSSWPTYQLYQSQQTSQPAPDGSHPPPPQVHMSSAVAVADLEAGGIPAPSVVIAYTVSGLPPGDIRRLTLLHRVSATGTAQNVLTVPLPAAEPHADVTSMAIACGRIYLLLGRRMFSAPVTASSVGSWQELAGWDAVLPKDWQQVALAAVDYTGDGYADLAVLYSRYLSSSLPGAPAVQGGLRIRYLAPDGTLGTWGPEIEVSAPLSAGQLYLLYAGITHDTKLSRFDVTQAFRTAAGAVQGQIVNWIPASNPVPPLQSVPVDALAGSVRTALDPAAAVPAALAGRIDLGGETDPAGGDLDPLASLLVLPHFDQPLSQLQLASGLSQLVPGMPQFPPDSVTVLQSDPAVVEAILTGANTEFGRELAWRGFPAPTGGSYFRQYWTGGPDITDQADWPADSALGSHAPPGRQTEHLTVVVIRGELIRQLSELSIYAAPAVATASGKRTVDFSRRIDPLFEGVLAADTRFLAFAFSVEQARGDTDGLGYYLIYQEHGGAGRFGFDEPATEPPTTFSPPAHWRDLTWSEVAGSADGYQALRYADGGVATLRKLSLPDLPGQPVRHWWGLAAADMAHISARPPALIVVHLSVYLAAEG